MVSPLPNTNSSRKAVSLLKYSAKGERNGNESIRAGVKRTKKHLKKKCIYICPTDASMCLELLFARGKACLPQAGSNAERQLCTVQSGLWLIYKYGFTL